MSIIQRVPWTVQPQTPVGVDWGNPLARDLLVSLPLSRPAGYKSRGRNPITGTPTAASFGVTPKGSALKLSATGQIALGTTCLLPTSTTPFTLTLYELPDTAAAFSSLVGLSGGTQQWLWIRGTNAAYYCAMGRSNASFNAQNFSSVGAQVAGVGRRFLITGSGGVEGVGGTYRCWMDGVEQTSALVTYGAAASSTNYIGWDGYDTKFDGKLQDFNLWGRVLSDSEIASYFRNPYQIDAPQTRRIWVPVSAGGGSTDLTVQDATHGHTADGPTFTLSSFLAAQDATHSQAADNLALTLATYLAIQDATHAHTADNLTLSVAGSTSLTIQDATHAHAADSITLATSSYLAVADALHAHGADNLALTVDGAVDIVIADAAHAHAADSITLEGVGADNAGGRKKAKTKKLAWKEYDVPMPAEVLTSSIPSDKIAEPISLGGSKPAAVKPSKLAAPRRPKAPRVASVALVAQVTPAPVVAPEPAPVVAVAKPAPRPMMLSDMLSAESMTNEEMLAAIKMLARLHMGPQLMRDTPRAKLIRQAQ